MKLIPLLALLLVGCATAPTVPTAPLFRSASITGNSSEAAIEQGFIQSLADCQVVIRGLEDQSTQVKRWGVAIQLIGAVAGAVVAPALAAAHYAASTVAVWAGISGVANTAVSTVRQEALDAASIISQRAQITASMTTALTKFYAARAQDPMDKSVAVAAIDELRVSCIAYNLVSPSAPLIQ